jgi:hypothetical protein
MVPLPSNSATGSSRSCIEEALVQHAVHFGWCSERLKILRRPLFYGQIDPQQVTQHAVEIGRSLIALRLDTQWNDSRAGKLPWHPAQPIEGERFTLNPRVRTEFASFGPDLCRFPVIASFTHWVKSQYRAKACRYWPKPRFRSPYPWIWVLPLLLLYGIHFNPALRRAASSRSNTA